LRGLEFARRHLGQGVGGECCQRVFAVGGGDTGRLGEIGTFLAHGKQGLFGPCCPQRAFLAGLRFAPQPLVRLRVGNLRRFRRLPAFRGVRLGGFEPVGVLHGRVGLEGFQPRALRGERALGLFLFALCP